MKKMQGNFSFIQRLLAFVLVVTMVYGLMPVLPVSAQEFTGVEQVVDPATVNSYVDMLGTAATNGNRYAGRIWTDKSVYSDLSALAGDLRGELTDGQLGNLSMNPDEFMVVYSTLGSTTSVSSEITVGSDLDVVIVIDNSMSMSDTAGGSSATRQKLVVDAANELIYDLLENSSNRVAVVTYEADATTVLPLNSYVQTASCLSISSSGNSGGRPGQGGGRGVITASATIYGTTTKAGTSDSGFYPSTNQQAGINQGMKILYEANDTEKRVPVLIVLSDGVADTSTNADMIGDVSGISTVHPGDNTLYTGVALSTLLNAAYWKHMVGQKYNTQAVVYTVGVDISASEAEDAKVVMDPANAFRATDTTTVGKTAYAWYIDWATSTSSYTQRKDGYTWTFPQPSAQIKEAILDNIHYTDKYYDVTNAELSTTFDEILKTISNMSDAFHAITDSVEVDGDTPQTYVDFIGDYMELKNFSGVSLYGQWYSVAEDTSTPVSNGDGTVTVTTQYIVGQNADPIIDPITGETFLIREAVRVELLHTYAVDAQGNRITAGEQDLWIRIQKEVMPLIRHKVETVEDVTTYTVYDNYPVRFYYTVGVSEYIAPAGNLLLHRVDGEYLEQNTVDGTVYFYTNQYYEMNPESGATGYGDAHTAAIPNERNRYYFHQYNFNIFKSVTDSHGDSVIEENTDFGVPYDSSYIATPMTYGDMASMESNDRVYAMVTFHVPTGAGTPTADGGMQYAGEAVTYYVYATWGDLMSGVVFYDSIHGVYIHSDGTTASAGHYEDVADRSYAEDYASAQGIRVEDIHLYLGIGSWRIPRLHNMTLVKTENATGTAPLRVAPMRNIDDDTDHEGSIVAWLGNNGRIGYNAVPPKTVSNAAGKDIDGEKVMLGDVLTYTVTAVADQDGTTITITDKIPAGTTYVDGSATNGGVFADGTVTWIIENVDAGEQVEVSFAVTVTDPAVDSIDNAASVRIGDHEPYTTNTTRNYPEGKTAYVTMEPVGADGVQVGSHIRYTIYYYNTEQSAVTVTITDTLPAGTSFVSAEHGGVYDPQAETVTWVITNVPSGTSGSVSFDVHVDADAVSVIENYATIQIGGHAPYVTNTTENPLAYGDLVLRKILIGGYADRDFTLVLQSGFKSASALSGNFATDRGDEVSFVDGQAELTIRGGETVTILDLPAGVTVSVYEKQAPGYTASYSADAVRIVAEGKVSLDVTNRYATTSAGLNLTALKELANLRDLPAGIFDFEILDENGKSVSIGFHDGAQAGESGKITFTTIPYTAPGSYVYTVVEVDGKIDDVIYDRTVYTLEVNVEDDHNGALYIASVKIDGNTVYTGTATGTVTVESGVTFVNTYLADPAVFTPVFYKTLNGRDMTAGEFQFEITDGTATYYAVSKAGEDGVATLVSAEAMWFTEIGTYEYTVREVIGSLGGVEYDDRVIRMVVTVEEGENGLVASAEYYEADALLTGEEVGFVNTYAPTPITLTPGATKVLDGKNLAAEEFRFALYYNGEQIGLGTNDASGNVTFRMYDEDGVLSDVTTLTFTKAGIYRFEVKEINEGKAGYTYSDTVYTIEVTVTDDGAGNLMGTYRIYRENVEVGMVSFYNTYTPQPLQVELDVALEITKLVENPSGAQIERSGFIFEVRDWNDVLVATGTSDENGHVTFDNPLVFTMEGDYRFSIREVAGEIAGMDYDQTIWIVHVLVTYDADLGVLQVTDENLYAHIYTSARMEPDGTDEVIFTNRYAPQAVQTTVSFQKILAVAEDFDRVLREGEFTFLLMEGDAVIAQAQNDAEGNVHFDMTLDRVGKYVYTVREAIPEGAVLQEDGTYLHNGVIYSAETLEVTVEVTDGNGEPGTAGKLYAAVTHSEGKVTITNRYEAAAAQVQLGAVKVLNGRELKENEFTFVLSDGVTSVEATNDQAGNVLFPVITFDRVGEYVYTIYEKTGDLGGVRYSAVVYTATVKVTDNGVGALVAEVEYTYSDSNDVEHSVGLPVFVNEYTAAAAKVTISATKRLTGRDFAAEEFEFVLTDALGNIVTARNDADGTISFGEFVLTEAGTYIFRIYEIGGDEEGMTYDDRVITVTVEVTDNGEGALEANVQYSEEPIFRNLYEKPEEPTEPEPTEPEPTEPEPTEPEPTEPEPTEPEPTEPEPTEPEPTEPEPTEPEPTEPEPTEPEPTEPEPTEPELTEPEPTEPEPTEPEPTEPEPTEPEPTEPEPTEPEPTEPEPTDPESTEPETTDPDAPPKTGDEKLVQVAVLMMLCCIAAVTVLLVNKRKLLA